MKRIRQATRAVVSELKKTHEWKGTGGSFVYWGVQE